MSINYVKNGNFEMGDFSYWVPQGFDTPLEVVKWNMSYKAKLIGGRNQGQTLANRFKISPGAFRFSFDIQAPDAIELIGDEGSLLANAFIVCILTSFRSDGAATGVWPLSAFVDATKRTFSVEGVADLDSSSFEVVFAIGNDPYASKGAYYLDNVCLSIS